MLGRKPRHFKIHPSLTLDALVPEGHFYRELEAKLDLEFVRDLAMPDWDAPPLTR
jgi:hypothetical protein